MANISNYTRQSINGFIASEPRLSYGEDGLPRLYVRVGINHYNRREDGGYDQLEPTFHDLVQFGKGAERSADLFVKGDQFIAQGQPRDYTRQVDGQSRTDEQFLAARIAHDPNTTRYTVSRGREHQQNAVSNEATQTADQTADREPEDKPLSPAPSEPVASAGERSR